MTPGLISFDDFINRVRPVEVKVEFTEFKKKYLGASVSFIHQINLPLGIRDRHYHREWMECSLSIQKDLRRILSFTQSPYIKVQDRIVCKNATGF